VADSGFDEFNGVSLLSFGSEAHVDEIQLLDNNLSFVNETSVDSLGSYINGNLDDTWIEGTTEFSLDFFDNIHGNSNSEYAPSNISEEFTAGAPIEISGSSSVFDIPVEWGNLTIEQSDGLTESVVLETTPVVIEESRIPNEIGNISNTSFSIIDPVTAEELSNANLFLKSNSIDVVLESEKKKRAKNNERCKEYRQRRKQILTKEERLLQDLEAKNAKLKFTEKQLTEKKKTLQEYYLKAIATGKIRVFPN
jgi:hypothetical protein